MKMQTRGIPSYFGVSSTLSPKVSTYIPSSVTISQFPLSSISNFDVDFTLAASAGPEYEYGNVKDMSDSDGEEEQLFKRKSIPSPKLPSDPVAVFKKPAVVAALRKLAELQSKEDRKRFTHRLGPSQRKPKCNKHPFSSCCFAGNYEEDDGLSEWESATSESLGSGRSMPQDKDSRTLLPIGPFLSCPLHHTKSNDFEEFPDIYQGESTGDMHYGTASGHFHQFAPRPTSRNFRIKPRQLTGDRPNPNKCRGCPQTSITMLDPELWYQDYKFHITYGRISSTHKKTFAEKLQQWIGSDEYRDKINWIRSRSHSVNKYNASHRPIPHRLGGPNSFARKLAPFAQEDRSPSPMYGPFAIASVSGYTMKNRGPTISPAAYMQEITVMGGAVIPIRNIDTTTVPDDGIPWPSDTFRYFDDDSDPRITELLAKVPLKIPLEVKHLNLKENAPQNGTTKATPNLFGSMLKSGHRSSSKSSVGSFRTQSKRVEPMKPALPSPQLRNHPKVLPKKINGIINSVGSNAANLTLEKENGGDKSDNDGGDTASVKSSPELATFGTSRQDNGDQQPSVKTKSSENLRPAGKAMLDIKLDQIAQSRPKNSKNLKTRLARGSPSTKSNNVRSVQQKPLGKHKPGKKASSRKEKRFEQGISTVPLGFPKSNNVVL